MALFHMLTDYVFHTRPTVDFFAALLLLQIGLQIITPVTVMIQSIRRQNMVERFVLALFPLVFFVTYVFMDVLLGGAFLGGGFDEQRALAAYLLRAQVQREIWAVLLLFPVSFLIVRRWLKKSRLSMVGDLFVWLLFLLCLAVSAYIGAAHRVPSRPVPAETLVLWYVYAVYTLAAQLLLNLTGIVWHLLFSQRPVKGALDELIYDPDWCRRQIRRLLLEGNRVFFCSMMPLVVLLLCILLPGLRGEGAPAETYVFFVLLLFFPTALLVGIALQLIFPALVPALRRMERWERRDALYRQFCREYFDAAQPPRRGAALEATPHFILKRSPLTPSLYYAPMFLRGEQGTLLFQDGGRLRVKHLDAEDALLLRPLLRQTNKEVSYR